MKHSILASLLLGLLAPALGFTGQSLEGSYWQCTAHDKNNKQWTYKSAYQKVALNMAYAACKKESQTPTTCTWSKYNCEGYYAGISTSPMWRCTALDFSGAHWPSNLYSQRDDSALAAKAYCKDNSSLPETCYINMVTCVNLNEGVGS